MTGKPASPDPAADACRAAQAALDRHDARTGDSAALCTALEGLDRARRDGAVTPRVDAYRAQLLLALGRRREAAVPYAAALLADLRNAEAVHDGVRELLDLLGGLEEAERLATAAKERHPGRAWQWDALAAEARRRAALETQAPLPPPDLARFRAEVGRRLRDAPCRHDDDRRPVAAAAATALGFDAPRVLAWVAELGACCCDCQVARVAGPREPRTAD